MGLRRYRHLPPVHHTMGRVFTSSIHRPREQIWIISVVPFAGGCATIPDVQSDGLLSDTITIAGSGRL